jgi:hypothetical protein
MTDHRLLYSNAHDNQIQTGMICMIIFDVFCVGMAVYGSFMDKKNQRFLVPPVLDGAGNHMAVDVEGDNEPGRPSNVGAGGWRPEQNNQM